MRVWSLVLASLLSAALFASPARPQGCDDLLGIALGLGGDDPVIGKLGKINDVRGVVKAFLEAKTGKEAEAVGKALAETGITTYFGTGSAVLIATGKAYVNGVEWTVEAAEQLRTAAFLCGDVSGGSGRGVEGVFELRGAQAIAPGITCTNYADWLDTPAKFRAFRDFFKGHYSRSRREVGFDQSFLDRQWAVIEPTWQVREAERRLKKMQDEVTRRLTEKSKEVCQPKPPPSTELGADTSDPAKLPEPELPPGGMLVLTETVVTPHALDPSITHSAGPQRNSVNAYWGESACVWSAPPKALGTEEVFGFDFELSVSSKNQQRNSDVLIVKTGFANVNNLPNELSVAVEAGQAKSGKGHLELSAGDLAYAEDYMTWYLQIGGCGGNVDYIYKFRKP